MGALYNIPRAWAWKHFQQVQSTAALPTYTSELSPNEHVGASSDPSDFYKFTLAGQGLVE